MPTALPRSPCIPHPFIHSFIHSFISCAFYSRIHCCVRFNSGEAKRFSQHENAQAKSLCHYDILSFIAKSFEFLFRISLPNSQKTSLRFSKFRRPARRTHVILMLKFFIFAARKCTSKKPLSLRHFIFHRQVF